MLVREGQLQILGDEFDVDQAACDELQVPDVAVALFLGDERAHRPRFLSDLAASRSRVSVSRTVPATSAPRLASPATKRARVSAMCSQVSASSCW